MNYELTINVLQVNYEWTTKSWMEIHVMNFIHHVTMSNIGVNNNSQLLLQLHVIRFGLVWIIINNTKPSWFLNLNLCNINGSVYYKQTAKVMKTSHNLNQVISFWPFDLILKHSIHKKHKFMKNQMHNRLQLWTFSCNANSQFQKQVYKRNIQPKCSQALHTNTSRPIFPWRVLVVQSINTNFQVTLKFSIHLKSSYWVMKKIENQVVNLVFS
jgi:hypothetical protein